MGIDQDIEKNIPHKYTALWGLTQTKIVQTKNELNLPRKKFPEVLNCLEKMSRNLHSYPIPHPNQCAIPYAIPPFTFTVVHHYDFEKTEIQTERQTESQTEREADREGQRGRQTDKQVGRQTDRHR